MVGYSRPRNFSIKSRAGPFRTEDNFFIVFQWVPGCLTSIEQTHSCFFKLVFLNNIIFINFPISNEDEQNQMANSRKPSLPREIFLDYVFSFAIHV